MQKKIFEIVKNHFSLDEPSLNRFEKLLFTPDIDETYKSIIGEDLRYKIKISPSNLKNIDKGWFYFKKYFNLFIAEYKVQYEDFKRSKILIDKNEHRLFKLLKDYYIKNKEKLPIECDCRGCCESYLDERIEKIGNYKLPNKELYFVLSLNFADWFLCSTAENWSSCLNLESSFVGCYWTGLPGLIADKNRAMIYITDGTKKEWNNIKADSILSRSWVLLDKKNNINYLKFFPAKYMEPNEIDKSIKLNIQSININFISKYPINLLFHKHKNSCFIFQDYSRFNYYKPKIFYSNSGRMQVFDKKTNEYFEGTLFSYCDGLSRIIHNQKEINDYVFSKKACHDCRVLLNEEDFFIGCDEHYYCPDCFFEIFEICQNCDGTYYKNDMIITDDGYLCRHCYDTSFSVCNSCNKIINKNKVFHDNLCEDCYIDLYSCCDACDAYFLQEEMTKAPDGTSLCKDCYKKCVKICYKCKKEMMVEEAISFEYSILYICKDCQSKKNIS